MAQADVAQVLLADRVLLDQGLLSRILTSFPESAIGTRLSREPAAETPRELNRYHARLMDLLEAPLPLAGLARGDPQILKPPACRLSPKARALWVKFVDYVEVDMRDGGQYETIRGLANKLPEHAARLATVLEALAHLENCNTTRHAVSAGALASAMTVVQHYAGETIRLGAAGFVDPKLAASVRPLDWIRKRLSARERDVVSLAEMYQFGPPTYAAPRRPRRWCASWRATDGWSIWWAVRRSTASASAMFGAYGVNHDRHSLRPLDGTPFSKLQIAVVPLLKLLNLLKSPRSRTSRSNGSMALIA